LTSRMNPSEFVGRVLGLIIVLLLFGALFTLTLNVAMEAFDGPTLSWQQGVAFYITVYFIGSALHRDAS
jgi:hypothetical protein